MCSRCVWDGTRGGDGSGVPSCHCQSARVLWTRIDRIPVLFYHTVEWRKRFQSCLALCPCQGLGAQRSLPA